MSDPLLPQDDASTPLTNTITVLFDLKSTFVQQPVVR